MFAPFRYKTARGCECCLSKKLLSSSPREFYQIKIEAINERRFF